MDDLFLRLSRSAFRQRFALGPKELSYLTQKGFDVIKQLLPGVFNKMAWYCRTPSA